MAPVAAVGYVAVMSPLFRKNAPGDNAIRTEALVLSGDSGIGSTSSWLSLATLRVRIPGRDDARVAHECMVKRDKELVRGFTVPVLVDPDDSEKLSILWDEVPTINERIECRDPVILDPEPTWRSLHTSQYDKNVADRIPTPWAVSTIKDWPPVGELKKGRQPGTIWVIASSEDPKMCQTGSDDFMPPGRTHYRYSGVISYGPFSYQSWVLARVNPPYGEPYGLYWRTKIARWHYHDVLPVAINPDDPTDVEVVWDATPNIAREIADKITADVQEAHERVETITAVGKESTAAALANIADPVVREQAAQMLGKYGVGTTNPSVPPVAAAPSTALQRLEKLHASGVLDDAEFDAERAKLLAGN
jgi:hypothetical protein